MITLHPSFLEKNGRCESVILPADKYESLYAYLEDLEDLLDIRKAKEEDTDASDLSLSEVERKLGDQIVVSSSYMVFSGGNTV